MHDDRRSSPSLDPHGYQPLFVDENCLSNADCREAVLEAFNHPCDWQSVLKSKELAGLEKREPFETFILRADAAHLDTFRAYARPKYSGGRCIWYGDGIPWRQHAG